MQVTTSKEAPPNCFEASFKSASTMSIFCRPRRKKGKGGDKNKDKEPENDLKELAALEDTEKSKL